MLILSGKVGMGAARGVSTVTVGLNILTWLSFGN